MVKKSDILQVFGERVRQLRREQGLSQESLAAKCGLDRTYISGIERGNRNVSLRNIQLIATSLRCSLAELFAEV